MVIPSDPGTESSPSSEFPIIDASLSAAIQMTRAKEECPRFESLSVYFGLGECYCIWPGNRYLYHVPQTGQIEPVSETGKNEL